MCFRKNKTGNNKTEHLERWSIMKPIAALSLLLLLVTGFFSVSQADVRKPNAAFSTQELPDLQSIMNVVQKVNLRQVDRNTNRTFNEFFNRKNQMNESVQMLEKATAVRQTADTTLKAPPRQLPKAY